MAKKDTVEIQENTDIDSILIIREHGEAQEYSISDSNIEFDVEIEEDGSLGVKGGVITTPYFIQNSHLEYIRTWRYTLYDIELVGFHVNAKENVIKYGILVNGSFVDVTTLEDEGENDG